MNKDYFEGWTAPVEPRQTLQNERRTTLQLIPPLYIKTKVEAVFGADSAMALRIIACESGFRTDVISRTNDIGIFQINLAAHGLKIAPTRAEQIAYLQDVDNNIAFAYELFKKRGNFNDWVCFTKKLI